ncbi:hypothetical protein F5Y08DRAFT_338295 [Xylaria arbuscula]|nr:hypothetical protein F5Y08DRAFT_338295 [Xylaria arbuscula]
MDPESQNHRSALPSYLEEDIKAAVLASLPSNEPLQPTRKRKTVSWRKGLRWTVLSLAISILVAEIVASVILGLDVVEYFAFTWATLLILWNAWRLFRMKQKFDNERISGWHVGLESTTLLGCIAVTITVLVWSGNTYSSQRGYWDNYGDYQSLNRSYASLWRGVAVGTVFGLCGVFHSVLLALTIIEKWTKPRHMHTALAAGDAQQSQQQQQVPQIIVQYTPTCPVCHGHEPRRSEDENSYLARIGDSQPQGVAPVTIANHKEAMYTDETLSDYERYYGAAGVART